jgi:uncharacterized protein YvpB
MFLRSFRIFFITMIVISVGVLSSVLPTSAAQEHGILPSKSAQNSQNPPPHGQKVDIPKPKGLKPQPPKGKNRHDGKKGGTGQASASATTWWVSLTASSTTVGVNQNYTLTATASQDVGPTPYYIYIYWGSTSEASCAYGTTCSATLYNSTSGTSYTYQANIADYYGNSVQAWSNTVTVSTVGGWSISLSANMTTANVGQGFMLTARTNMDVGPTPYYIQIYWYSSNYASCGAGTSCSTGYLSGGRAGASYTFYARVSNYDGTGVQAVSNGVTIRIVAPSSVRLSVPFLTQMGSAGDPNSGSNNCGPASVAMSINFFGNSVTVNAAAIAIRGSNTLSNGPTDFKSTAATNYLAKYSLHPVSISTYSDLQSELALQHPVIILVNNNQYRYLNPYSNNNNGWFTTSHIIVVTGYDGTNVYVNDPLRYTANFSIPVATFQSAASTTPSSSSTSWYAESVSR